MAKGQFSTGGLRSVIAASNNLNQMMKERPEEVVRELTTMVATIPVSQVEANAGQPRKRFESEALEELAASIQSYGIIQPITVRYVQDKKYQIISGERRFRAAQLAGLQEIPAYIRLANDQELLEMALVENVQREDLTPWEVAISYGRLMDEFKLTQENLAKRVGKQRITITGYLSVLKLESDPEIKQGLIEGRISMGHGKALAQLDDFAYRKSLYHDILNKDLTVRAVEGFVNEYKNRYNKAQKKAKKGLSADLQSIQDQFNSFFGGGAQLKRDDSGKGQIVLRFRNDSELNQFLERIQ